MLLISLLKHTAKVFRTLPALFNLTRNYANLQSLILIPLIIIFLLLPATLGRKAKQERHEVTKPVASFQPTYRTSNSQHKHTLPESLR